MILSRGREFPNFYPKAVSNGQPFSLDSLPGPVALLARFREAESRQTKGTRVPGRPERRGRGGGGAGGDRTKGLFTERFDFRVHPLLPLVAHPGLVEVNTFPSGQREEWRKKTDILPSLLPRESPRLFPVVLFPGCELLGLAIDLLIH